jgi:glutamyl-tRNA reductase
VRVVLTGISHKTAPVELREKLSLYGRSQAETLHGLRNATGLQECAALSTCNRTEIYGLTREDDWQEQVLEFLARHAGVSPGHLQEYLYAHEGTPAVRHLFRVACGLDSMVMGEGQILGQVKDALRCAQECGTSGAVVNTLFQNAITCGKRARTETGIGRGAVSVSLAAVQLAKQIFQRLDGRLILLLGAGETGEETARMLLVGTPAELGHHPPKMLVCNRTPERAEALAGQFGGSALPFEKMADGLARADIVISSTGAPRPIITKAHLRAAMRARRGRPLFLIDIAVPRDVEAEAAEDLDDVYLYNIDDLKGVVDKNVAGRQAEAERVEALVEDELEKFRSWQRSLEVVPTIRQLQELFQRTAQGECERAGTRLAHLSPEDREAVETLVRGVAKRLQQPLILHLKEAAASGNGYHEVEQIRAIFGLDAGPEQEERP